jgi:DNA-binding MarR family transcriptional regulator
MDTTTLRKAELLGIKLMKVSEGIQGAAHGLFKRHGLSAPQYNVLRILRGAGAEGLRCQEISERMVSRVPDITRLLDRLGDKDLVVRERSADDRRVVMSRITDGGLALLKGIDGPLKDQVHTHFDGFDDQALTRLDKLLDKLTDGLGNDSTRRKDK